MHVSINQKANVNLDSNVNVRSNMIVDVKIGLNKTRHVYRYDENRNEIDM